MKEHQELQKLGDVILLFNNINKLFFMFFESVLLKNYLPTLFNTKKNNDFCSKLYIEKKNSSKYYGY